MTGIRRQGGRQQRLSFSGRPYEAWQQTSCQRRISHQDFDAGRDASIGRLASSDQTYRVRTTFELTIASLSTPWPYLSHGPFAASDAAASRHESSNLRHWRRLRSYISIRVRQTSNRSGARLAHMKLTTKITRACNGRDHLIRDSQSENRILQESHRNELMPTGVRAVVGGSAHDEDARNKYGLGLARPKRDSYHAEDIAS